MTSRIFIAASLVIPAQAGIHYPCSERLTSGSRLRRDDRMVDMETAHGYYGAFVVI
jgi:hypothetical protein